MTVDCCTRIWSGPDPFGMTERLPVAGGRGVYEAAMHCVQASFLVGYRSERLGVHEPMERVAARVHEDPDRLVGFAGIDPLAPGVTEDLHRSAELGLSGVAISPADQGCRPTHDRCLEVLEWCASCGVPVLVSNPGVVRAESVLEYVRPALFDEAARQVRGLTLILGDLGRSSLEEALLMCAKHPRVYAELSTLARRPGTLYFGLLAAYERGVMPKMLFGSGYPQETPERVIERVYSVNSVAGGPVGGGGWPVIPRSALKGVVERDAVACLGLDEPIAVRTGLPAPRESPAAVPAGGSG